ncbi:MAG: tandem-95 repeat protein, partial [Gammaproteobacteria bacterium]|nr:tandem-95 repeat protein [Gammaproteobacteria bacterium]
MLIAFFTAFFRSRSLITPVTNQVSLVNRFISHFFSLLLFISLPSLAAVTSISGPANGTYNSNDSLKFVVSFSESINYTPAEDSTSYLILALDSGLAYAEYQSISANKVTFSYTPTAKDFDFDGNIGFNGFYQFEVSSFGVTNGDEKLNVDKVANLSAVFIEHSNIADFPDNDLYLPGDMLTFSLRWRGISTVAITGGTPQLTININNTLHVINAVAAGQGRIDFNYPINNFDIDTDGIKIESFQLNNATIFGTLDGTQDNSVGSHVLTVANTNFVNNSLTSKVTLLSNNSSAVLVGEAIIPKVTSVDVPVAGDYVTGNSISFTVHFDQAVQTSDPASTKLRIKLDNEREILANYASASGAQTSWKFDYSLTLDDIDRNGIELVALESDGGFVSDTGAYLFSDWHDLPLNNIGDTSKITFNLISLLQIVSVDMPNSGGYFTGDVLNFTVNFANNITVTGQPLLHLTIGNKQIIAQYVSGSGTSALVFSYQITEQLVNSDDISLGKFDLNGATLLSESESEGNSDGSYINNPPLTIEDTASLDEDGTIVIAVLDNDVDAEGFLIASSIVVLNQPTNGQTSVDTINGVITYTPFANFNGTDTFTYQVADFQGATSLSTLVTISINAVNDLPTLNDDLALSQEDSPVLVDVLKNDSDIDVDDQLDAGSLVILNEPTNGQAQVVDGKINYSPRTNFNGSDSFSYQVADSFGALGEAATVTLNISNSNDAPITNELESQEPPQLSLPEAISFDATALYTRVNLGIASATDYLGNSLPVLLDGTPFYKPGNNVAVWTTKDAAGRTARAEQQVNIRPLISLDKDQTVVEGERVTIKVLLNGHSPVYPLTIPYTVSGSATTGLDHDLSDGDIIVESGTEAEISFNILRDSQTDVENNAENEQPNKDIIITLDPSLNRGQKVSQQILISQENIAPRVALSAIQNSIQTLTVTQVDGLVTVNLSFTDPDSSSDNEHVIDWSDSDLSLTNQSSDELIYIFDPASLSKGLYRVSVTVTDVQGLSNTDFVSVKIIDTLPTLTTMDSDGDGIADNEEGYFDQDGDGIPDYQDTITACNILPQTALSQSMLSQTGDNQQQFLVEGELGSCLQLGNIASLSDNASAQLDPNDILTDGSTDNIGGVFDFI